MIEKIVTDADNIPCSYDYITFQGEEYTFTFCGMREVKKGLYTPLYTNNKTVLDMAQIEALIIQEQE